MPDFAQLTSDSIPMVYQGMDELLLIDAGLIFDGGSLNIPWLVEISSALGNAYTEAISRNAVVLCEIESWEGMGGGGNQPNFNGPWRTAGPSGYTSIWW